MDALVALMATELFGGATREELEPLAPALRERAYARGAHVFRAGDAVTAAYVVLKGLVKVGIIGSAEHDLVVNIKVPGDTFGEYWLFEENAQRRYDAVAIVHSQCLVIAKDALMYFLERHPKLMRRLTAALLRRIINEFIILTDTQSVADIAGRLARRLRMLADAHGEPTTNGVRIPFRLSQATLAAMVRGSRENVNRILTRMTGDGLIAHDGGYITLLQPQKLESGLTSKWSPNGEG